MTRSANDVRREFIEFFEKKHGHTFVPGSPVVPHDDPTLMFTNAGMNQFKPLFLGTADRNSELGRLKRAANSQPCIRAGGKHNDLDDVGHDTYHHTLFEMLGNWSFGDYFKREAIEWAWELLTKVWGMDPQRLNATYFGGDAAEGLEPDYESRDLWAKIAGLPPERIHPGSKKDNFWEMGDTGPCGPCSEIHVDLTPDKSGAPLVNQGDARVIEIWNLVFIQFNRGSDGKLTPLPAKHVDTGMGLERVASMLQGHNNNYGTDVFVPIFEHLERITGHKYGETTQGVKVANRFAVFDADDMKDTAFRVVADHIRTLTFAIADGALPDKEGRGYVLRRILRRAVRYGWQHLGLHEPFLSNLVLTVIDTMGSAFPVLKKRPAHIIDVIRDEEESFGRTLERGIELFETAVATARAGGRVSINGADAFKLHDTYGFPIDLTQVMAKERGFNVDSKEYERLMEEARNKARAGDSDSHNFIAAVPRAALAAAGATTDASKYSLEPIEAEVVAMFCFNEDGSVTEPPRDGALHHGQFGCLVLDCTNFYAEQGGQIGDRGVILTNRDEAESHELFDVEDTLRIGDAVLHIGHVRRGGFGFGEVVFLFVGERRASTMKNHTATHVMNWALREVLDPSGEHLQQKGSLVDPDKTRFDFAHGRSLTVTEVERIEALVSEQIRAKLIVDTNDNVPVAQREAMKINGLRAVFGEKYPDEVRVVSIGATVADLLHNPANPDWRKFSIEFCGGTHVKNTAEIEDFAIVAEEGVAKGVRRIVGITAGKAREASEIGKRLLNRAAELKVAAGEKLAGGLHELQRDIDAAVSEMKLRVVDRAQLRDAIGELQQLAKKAEKSHAADAAAEVAERVSALIAAGTKRGATTIVVGELAELPIEQVKHGADIIKQRCGSAAVLLGVRQAPTEKEPAGKALLLAAVTDDLIKKGLKAGDLIKSIAPIVEGGGGGPPTMAQAGGKNPAKLAEALAAGMAWFSERLG